MRVVDTDALAGVASALGIGAPATVTEAVQFDDSVLQQVLDVAPLLRRAAARNSPESLVGNMYLCRLECVHPGADAQLATVPMAGNPTFQSSSWPRTSIEQGRSEVWLLGTNARRTAGAGNLTVGSLYTEASDLPGLGISAPGGTALLSGGRLTWAAWDAMVGASLQSVDTRLWIPIGIRLPTRRVGQSYSAELNFATTSDAAATFLCTTLLGVFPRALGQDGAI